MEGLLWKMKSMIHPETHIAKVEVSFWNSRNLGTIHAVDISHLLMEYIAITFLYIVG